MAVMPMMSKMPPIPIPNPIMDMLSPPDVDSSGFSFDFDVEKLNVELNVIIRCGGSVSIPSDGIGTGIVGGIALTALTTTKTNEQIL
jgi:hypothetical protein